MEVFYILLKIVALFSKSRLMNDLTHALTKTFNFAHDMEVRNVLKSVQDGCVGLSNSCNCILCLNILMYELLY